MDKPTTISCTYCPREFSTISSKYRHERVQHSTAIEGKQTFECAHCPASLSSKFAKERHEKAKHGIENTRENPKTDIQCTECMIFFRSVKNLREHLSSVHDKDMSPTVLFFKTLMDFQQWKENEEYKRQIAYVVLATVQLGKTTYYCQRSGVRRPHRQRHGSSEGKKTRKSRGSRKLGMYCTSTIEVYRKEDGFIVEYYPNHYGHELSFLGHCQMRVPLEKKELLEAENIQVYPDETIDERIIVTAIPGDFDTIVSSGETRNLNANLYENIPDDVVKEIRLRCNEGSFLTEKQDVQNIALDFGYETLKGLHKSDQISCQLIIESLGKEVLYSKQQGVLDKDNPEIAENEFVLIIMTEAQEKLFRERISRTRLLTVSVDSTHGISGAEFHATTFMIVDDDNLGFPDAVCISSKVNEQILSLYFEKIKEKFCALYANIFMSDGIPIFRNAWKKVMGNSSINNSLICSFYLEKAWRKKIEAISNADQEAKSTIYSICCTLLEMEDEEKFWNTARAFMLNLELCEYLGFKNYFETSYLHENRVAMWATCFRNGITNNTNKHLETLQKILRYVLFYGKMGKRLDKCILGILKLIDSRVSNRKLRKCGSSLSRSVKEIESGVFSVQAANYENNQYLVKRSHNCTNCKEKCTLCGACSHIYICECEDYKSNVCKHVNAVTMYLNALKKIEPNKPKALGNPEDVIMEDITESGISDIGELKVQKISNILDIQDEIRQQLADKDFPYHVYASIENQLKQIKETLNISSLNTKREVHDIKNSIFDKDIPQRKTITLQLI